MRTPTHDPRISQILQLVSQLTNGGSVGSESADEREMDDLDRILAGLAVLVKQTGQTPPAQQTVEATLQTTNSLLTAIVEAAPTPIIGLDLDARVHTVWNRAAEKMLGWSAAEAMGRVLPSVPPTDDAELQQLRERIRSGKTQDGMEVRRQKRDGTPIECSVYASPLHDSEGRMTGAVTVLVDVTERKRAEQAIRENQAVLQATLESIQDGLLVVDCHGAVSHYNARFCAMWSIPEHMLQTTSDDALIAWVQLQVVDPEQFSGRIAQIRQSSSLAEDTLRLRDGRRFDRASYPLIQEGEIKGRVWVFRDVTAQQRAEEALRTSEARYRALIESQIDLVSRYLPDTTLTFVNDAYCQFYGKTREELIGSSYLTMVAPKFHEVTRKEAEDLAANPRTISGEYVNYRRDGTPCWIHWVVQSIVGEGGRVVEIQAIGRDVTRLKQVEAALRESEFFLQKSQAVARLGSYYFDVRTDSWISSYMLDELFGIDAAFRKDIGGWLALIHPDERAYLDHYMRHHVLVEHNRFDQVYRIIRQNDGQERWVHGLGELEFDDQGNVIRMIGTIQDITERQIAEEKLRKSEALLNESQQFAHMGSWEMDVRTGALTWSDGAFRLFGFQPQAVQPSFDLLISIIHPDDQPIVRAHLPQSLATRQFDPLSYRVVLPDGTIRRMLNTGTVTADDAGELRRFFGMVQDVTEQYQAEESLRISEARLREAQAVAHIGSWDMNLAANDMYASDEIYRIQGLQPQAFQLNPANFLERVHPDDQETIQASLIESFAGRSAGPINHRIVRPDGQIRWVEQRGQLVLDADGHPVRIYGTTQDITDRKQVELERQMLASIVETSSDFVGIADLDGRVQYINPAGLRMVGIASLAEACQLRFTDYFPAEEQARFTQELLPIILNNGWWTGETQLRRFGGEATIAVDMSFVLIRDTASGKPGIANISRDISERKRDEIAIQQLNKDLEQRVIERTAELEAANTEIKNFAYIVSHDMRAPLVNLKGFAAELRAALEIVNTVSAEMLPCVDAVKREALVRALQDDIPEALQYIESSVDHMDGFTRAILKLSRLGRQQLDLGPVDVRAIVDKTLHTLAYQINERQAQVTVGDLPTVVADRVSLEQIIGNILANAVLYLQPGRPGQIAISGERLETETVFRIRDNGRGIAPEDMKNVFAPFRRAGEQDVPGEGMGMAYVQTLVRRHGGRITCESAPGFGTTFTFTIAAHLAGDADLV
ncbi:MAG: PAS domain S-box protein [Anaerolineae bacterium]|nr:PAS domain S-box protein [Anaerolineae bacterium]